MGSGDSIPGSGREEDSVSMVAGTPQTYYTVRGDERLLHVAMVEGFVGVRRAPDQEQVWWAPPAHTPPGSFW